MIRLSKLSDYAIVLASYLAREHGHRTSCTARELAERAALPLPTVGKILKALCRKGLLISHRGARGGYSLARAPETISVVDIIEAVDGPIALTQCSSAAAPGSCELQQMCPVRGNWQIINQAVAKALTQLTLLDMTTPLTCVTSSSTPLVQRNAASGGARTLTLVGG